MPIGSDIDVTLPTQGGNTGTWGTDLNTQITKIVTAVEAQVPVTAIDASADLSMGGNGITALERTVYQAQSSNPVDLMSVFFTTAGEFAVRDNSNNVITITNAGNLNNAGAGGLGDSGGDYGTGGITFDWDATRYKALSGSGADDYANVRMGAAEIRDGSGNTLTVDVPAMSSDYSFTLPAAVPAAAALLQSDTSGNVTFSSSLATDITLTSSAEIKHGTRTKVINATTGMVSSNSTASSHYSTGEVTPGATSLGVAFPLDLMTGDRIINIYVYCFGGNTGSKACHIISNAACDATEVEEDNTASTTAGAHTITWTAINHTVASNSMWFRFSTAHASDRILSIRVQWDRP